MPWLVSSHNHIYNQKQLPKSGHIHWECSVCNDSLYCQAGVKQIDWNFIACDVQHVCVPKSSALAGAKVCTHINTLSKTGTCNTAATIMTKTSRWPPWPHNLYHLFASVTDLKVSHQQTQPHSSSTFNTMSLLVVFFKSAEEWYMDYLQISQFLGHRDSIKQVPICSNVRQINQWLLCHNPPHYCNRW